MLLLWMQPRALNPLAVSKRLWQGTASALVPGRSEIKQCQTQVNKSAWKLEPWLTDRSWLGLAFPLLFDRPSLYNNASRMERQRCS